jgi:hypothetical protein
MRKNSSDWPPSPSPSLKSGLAFLIQSSQALMVVGSVNHSMTNLGDRRPVDLSMTRGTIRFGAPSSRDCPSNGNMPQHQ